MYHTFVILLFCLRITVNVFLIFFWIFLFMTVWNVTFFLKPFEKFVWEKIDINSCLCIKQLKNIISCGLAYVLSVIHHESSIFSSSFDNISHSPRSNCSVVYLFFFFWTNLWFVWNTISLRGLFHLVPFDFFISLLFYILTLKLVVFKSFERKCYASCTDYSIPCMKRNDIFFIKLTPTNQIFGKFSFDITHLRFSIFSLKKRR